MLKTALRRSLAVVALALTLTSSEAAPVAYDESILGDISGGTFALDVGTNTVRGEMNLVLRFADPFGPPTITAADLDPFSFTLPAGTALLSATIRPVFTDTTGRTTEADLVTFLAYAGFTTSEDHCFNMAGSNTNLCESLPGGTGNMAPAALPRSDAMFWLDYSFFLGSVDPTQDYGGTTNYVVSLVVQPVDEPPTALLAGLGFVVLLARKRS